MTNFPTIDQLKRAIQIEEQIAVLQSELRAVLGGTGTVALATGTRIQYSGDKRTGKRSAATRAKMAAAQKARWAQKSGGAVEAEAVAEKPAKAKKKRKMSPEGRARIIEAQKKRWAAMKAKKGE